MLGSISAYFPIFLTFLKPENVSNTANKPASEVKRTFRKLVVEEEIHTTRLGCFFFARLYLNLKETRHKWTMWSTVHGNFFLFLWYQWGFSGDIWISKGWVLQEKVMRDIFYISHQLCSVNNGRSQGARENGRCLKGSIGNLVTNSRAKQASSRTLLFLHFRAHTMCDQIWKIFTGFKISILKIIRTRRPDLDKYRDFYET